MASPQFLSPFKQSWAKSIHTPGFALFFNIWINWQESYSLHIIHTVHIQHLYYWGIINMNGMNKDEIIWAIQTGKYLSFSLNLPIPSAPSVCPIFQFIYFDNGMRRSYHKHGLCLCQGCRTIQNQSEECESLVPSHVSGSSPQNIIFKQNPVGNCNFQTCSWTHTYIYPHIMFLCPMR